MVNMSGKRRLDWELILNSNVSFNTSTYSSFKAAIFATQLHVFISRFIFFKRNALMSGFDSATNRSFGILL